MTLSDGTTIAQQCVILDLIGKETGLYSTDIVTAAKVDEFMDHMKVVYSRTIITDGEGIEEEEKLKTRNAAVEEGGEVFDTLSK